MATTGLRRDHRRRRLLDDVAIVMDPRDRCRQGLPQRQVVRPDLARAELVEELQDARPAFGRVVELDVEIGDAPDPERLAQLVPDERHRPAEGGDGRRLLAGWPMTLTQTRAWRRSGVVSTRVIVANPIARIRDLPGHDRPDLLPEQLVDPVGALAHGTAIRPRPRARSSAS